MSGAYMKTRNKATFDREDVTAAVCVVWRYLNANLPGREAEILPLIEVFNTSLESVFSYFPGINLKNLLSDLAYKIKSKL